MFPHLAAELAKINNLPFSKEKPLDSYIEAKNRFDALKKEREAAFAKYQSLAGEVSARNVQERHAQDAYAVFPHATPGYPTTPQIIQGQKPPLE